MDDSCVSRADVVVVIPARYGSSRFIGKPLARIGNKPLVQQVYDRVSTARGVKRVIVATDDERILTVVQNFGGTAMMTGQDLRTGSDRVAHIAQQVPADVYINLQGDEIPLAAGFLEDLIFPFIESGAEVGTLKRAMTDERELSDPNVVKVVTDEQGFALYFSRSPIPYVRDGPAGRTVLTAGLHWKHLGIYAYTRGALIRFAGLPAGSLERSEQLEQLRLLEAGIRIRVWETKHESLRIDTPSDLQQAEQILAHVSTRGEPACHNSSL
ncbi:MAG: 3-deoxy-manno-octulosonate cytidylyltransferase [Nitrospirota bacterium]